jgi:signal peptidase I
MRSVDKQDAVVRKEAAALLKHGRRALRVGKGKGKGEREARRAELAKAVAEMEAAVQRGDATAIRQHLPPLDGLIDELTEPDGRSVIREYTESIGVAVIIALLLRAFVIEAFKIPSSSMYPTLEIGDHIFVSKFLYGVRVPFSDMKLFQVRPPKRGEVAVFLWPCNHDRDYIKRIVALEGDTVEVRCDVVYVNGKAVPSSLVDDADSFTDDNGSVSNVSRYREQLGEFTYDTYHRIDRPIKERRRSDADHTIDPFGEGTDFPDLRQTPPRPPTCFDQPRSEVDPNRPPQLEGKLVRTARTEDVGECGQQLHYVVPPGYVFGMGDDRWNSNDSRKWGAFPVDNLKGKAMFIWFSYSRWSLLDWGGVRWSRIGNFVH